MGSRCGGLLCSPLCRKPLPRTANLLNGTCDAGVISSLLAAAWGLTEVLVGATCVDTYEASVWQEPSTRSGVPTASWGPAQRARRYVILASPP